MMRWLATLGVFSGMLVLSGCAFGLGGGEVNPFLTLTEAFGIAAGGGTTDGGGAGGTAAEEEFRRTMTVSFINNHSFARAELSFVAWVNANSIRSAEQQDALLRGGYVQLGREVELGSAFVLPVGTFVFDGPGYAGATSVSLGCPNLPSARDPFSEVTLITPDVFLAFSQPPVSCDSVAFTFVDATGGTVAGPVTGPGGFKTLAQVDVYQCEPLRPGLFLKLGGGGRASNEYLEGENATFQFNEQADADGNFAIVTISEE